MDKSVPVRGLAHALVFLADEEKHGVGFPRQGTTILANMLGHTATRQTAN